MFFIVKIALYIAVAMPRNSSLLKDVDKLHLAFLKLIYNVICFLRFEIFYLLFVFINFFFRFPSFLFCFVSGEEVQGWYFGRSVFL